MEAEKAKRISVEQREAMLNFMESHPSLATGRFTGPDGARHKQVLFTALADTLNSLPSGVTKTVDKWYKSWQDLRTDVKAKAAAYRSEVNKTGGGQNRAKPLTPLEERLLGFLGPTSVHGHEEVADPMRLQAPAGGNMEVVVDEDTIVIPLDMPVPPLSVSQPQPSTSFTPQPGPSTLLTAQPGPSSAPQFFMPIASPPFHIISPPPPSSSPTVSEESSRTSPWPQNQCPRPVSREGSERTKRRRPTDGTLSDPEEAGGTKMLGLMERQVIAQERSNDIQERQCKAIEDVSVAVCEALKEVKNYFKEKRDSARPQDFFD